MDVHHRTDRVMTFGDLQIAYDSDVLEPRPWTLLQSQWAIDLAAKVPPGPMLELCAGVGHIGLVAAASTGRALVQVDDDANATRLARENAIAAGLGDQVDVRCTHLADAVADGEAFPLVLADPPYLRTSEVGDEPDDPDHMIDGGEDGLHVLKECLLVIEQALAPGGVALVQVRGRAQGEQIAALLPPHLAVIEIREDDPVRAVALIRPIDPATGRVVMVDRDVRP